MTVTRTPPSAPASAARPRGLEPDDRPSPLRLPPRGAPLRRRAICRRRRRRRRSRAASRRRARSAAAACRHRRRPPSLCRSRRCAVRRGLLVALLPGAGGVGFGGVGAGGVGVGVVGVGGAGGSTLGSLLGSGSGSLLGSVPVPLSAAVSVPPSPSAISTLAVAAPAACGAKATVTMQSSPGSSVAPEQASSPIAKAVEPPTVTASAGSAAARGTAVRHAQRDRRRRRPDPHRAEVVRRGRQRQRRSRRDREGGQIEPEQLRGRIRRVLAEVQPRVRGAGRGRRVDDRDEAVLAGRERHAGAVVVGDLELRAVGAVDPDAVGRDVRGARAGVVDAVSRRAAAGADEHRAERRPAAGGGGDDRDHADAAERRARGRDVAGDLQRRGAAR